MRFSWLSFLQTRGIPYVEYGPNVARGFVNIKCPFCGQADRSEHMGLSLSSTFWGCWRDESHRGKKPAWLVARLLGISHEQAQRIVGDGEALPIRVDLDDLRERLAGRKTEEGLEAVRFPPELFPLSDPPRNGRALRLYRYLVDRGLEPSRAVAHDYRLRGAVEGDFKDRVVFPIERDGELLGWTGRAIGRARVRYKSYPPGRTLADLLYEVPDLRHGERLILVEGPFDAVKLHYLSKLYGGHVGVAALLGLAPTDGKLARILALNPSPLGILLDAEAESKARKLASRLAVLRPVVLRLPPGVEDPGDLQTEADLRYVLDQFYKLG